MTKGLQLPKLSKLLALSLTITLISLMFTMPAKGQAVTTTTNVSIPVDISVFIPCANGGVGEDVQLSGNLHILLRFTANKNSVTIRSHFQPQGISGSGSVTGDKYQGTGVTQDTVNLKNDGGPFEETFVNNFRIIGQGPGNNFLVHENFHVTFDNNGNLTAFHDNISVDCK